MRKIRNLALFSLMAFAFTACGSEGGSGSVTYKDGTYSGRSADHAADESGNGAGYGTVELTIAGGKVTACTFAMYEIDGTLKDDQYGAELSRENRLKAQKAVQAGQKYASGLAEKGELSSVDAISGATISYSEFEEAVQDALKKAVK